MIVVMGKQLSENNNLEKDRIFKVSSKFGA